jgi:hypothetical protein
LPFAGYLNVVVLDEIFDDRLPGDNDVVGLGFGSGTYIGGLSLQRISGLAFTAEIGPFIALAAVVEYADTVLTPVCIRAYLERAALVFAEHRSRVGQSCTLRFGYRFRRVSLTAG